MSVPFTKRLKNTVYGELLYRLYNCEVITIKQLKQYNLNGKIL